MAADNSSVTLDNRAYDADYDLAYMAAGNAVATDAGGLVYNFHPGVNFTMKRAYTQLAVSLTRGADYGGTGAVTAVSLHAQRRRKTLFFRHTEHCYRRLYRRHCRCG